jgi:hypothetical protein
MTMGHHQFLQNIENNKSVLNKKLLKSRDIIVVGRSRRDSTSPTAPDVAVPGVLPEATQQPSPFGGRPSMLVRDVLRQ